MAKKPSGRRNAAAKALENPVYRQRVVPDKRSKARDKEINREVRQQLVKKTDMG